MKHSDRFKQAGGRWAEMSEADKVPYHKKAEEDK
jgi:hypothetical protein